MPNIRKANENDSRDIFEWRNDELTRQMSHTSNVVEWDGHSKWFASSLANQNRLLLICEDEGTKEKVAIVRFDVEDERAVISINLSPFMRGKRTAKDCLNDAIKFFKNAHPNVGFIDAEIKSVNVASQRSFVGVGFVLVREEVEVLFYEYDLCGFQSPFN